MIGDILLEKRIKAELEFKRAVQSKDSECIYRAMDTLNKIDEELLKIEHEKSEKEIREIKVDESSDFNRSVERKRQYLIAQFEYLTGKKIKGNIYDLPIRPTLSPISNR